MKCTEVLKTRISPDLKLRAKEIADRELLSEAAWLKRLVTREIRARTAANADVFNPGQADGRLRPAKEIREQGRCGRPMLVRLRNEDRLLLDARAETRGMRPATYVSVLTRAHLRACAPLPKEEFLALKRCIAELAAIGRNINQMARVANESGKAPGSVREEFRAILKICEALRDNVKAILKANETSWRADHA